jgi:hypothetical protein
VLKLEPRSKLIIDQETAALWTDGPTSETFRNWHKKGLPREGTPARPRYYGPDLLVWYAYYQRLVKKGQGRRIGHVDIEEARAWWLKQQYDDDPTHWILVPLDHDHPHRAELLKRAAVGIPPAVLDDADLHNDSAEEPL